MLQGRGPGGLWEHWQGTRSSQEGRGELGVSTNPTRAPPVCATHTGSGTVVGTLRSELGRVGPTSSRTFSSLDSQLPAPAKEKGCQSRDRRMDHGKRAPVHINPEQPVVPTLCLSLSLCPPLSICVLSFPLVFATL